MHFKPQQQDYEILDRLDEIQIQDGQGKNFYELKNGLVALSYWGMLKIAEVNGIQVVDSQLDESKENISAVVKAKLNGTKRIGGSSCENTSENKRANVAYEKAFRNVIRQLLSPSYLTYCLNNFMRRK